MLLGKRTPLLITGIFSGLTPSLISIFFYCVGYRNNTVYLGIIILLSAHEALVYAEINPSGIDQLKTSCSHACKESRGQGVGIVGMNYVGFFFMLYNILQLRKEMQVCFTFKSQRVYILNIFFLHN